VLFSRLIFFFCCDWLILWYSLNYLHQSLLEEIAPTWVNVSLRMKDDPETDKAFGWVLEM
jgi:hypothetical protein